MLTDDLIQRLHLEDEGRWRTANRGKEIDAYFLRSQMRRLLPTEGEYSKTASRRWRRPANEKDPTSSSPPGVNPQFGYHELHFANAFERYLGKGLPSAAIGEADAEADQEPSKDTSSFSGTKSTLLSDHPTQSRETLENAGDSEVSDEPIDPAQCRTPSDTNADDTASCRTATDTVSDGEGLRDTDIPEQLQHVTPAVSDGRIKAAKKKKKNNNIATLPSSFPHGARGRKARKPRLEASVDTTASLDTTVDPGEAS
jgi:hypothetical protein